MKGLISLVILVISLVFILIPLHLSKSQSALYRSIVRIGKTFAAGVFLGATFLHLYPESSSLLSSLSYPLTGMLTLSAYFAMLFIEKVAFTDHELVSHGHQHADLGCHSNSDHSDEEEDKMKHVLSTRTRLYSHMEEGDGENCYTVCRIDHPLMGENDIKNKSIAPSVILACALSIHSIIEGITLGIQSRQTPLINLAVAIITHKVPEAVVVGITIADTRKQLKIAMILIYCIATPIGILGGAIVNRSMDMIMEGVFLGICAGTFLYISATEIIVEEFAVSRMKYQKFLSVVCGVLFMSGLMFLEG